MSEEVPRRWVNRIVGHAEEDPNGLLANPRNYRLHSAMQQDLTVAALDQIGWISEVMVNQRTGCVVDGHMRVILALRHNEPFVPVRYVDLSDEEEALALRTYDPLGELADLDKTKLKDLQAECEKLSMKPETLAMLAQLQQLSPVAIAERRAAMGAEAVAAAEAQDEAAKDLPEAQVRVVQIFLADSDLDEFRTLLARLGVIYSTETPSDTVLQALRNDWNATPTKLKEEALAVLASGSDIDPDEDDDAGEDEGDD